MSDFAAEMLIIGGFWILVVIGIEIFGLIISGIQEKRDKGDKDE